MTNFRYSQNPRMARKRPSRTSRVATRRRATRLGDSRRSSFDGVREPLAPNPRTHRQSRRANRKTANTYFIHDVAFPADFVDEGDIQDWAEDVFRGWFTDVEATYAYGSLNLLVTDGSNNIDSAISSGDINARDVERLDENGDYRPFTSSRRANHKRASEQNPIDNIDVVDVGGGHAQIHVKSGNLTVFTIYERYNTENYYVMQIERLRNRTSSGIGSYLIDPTEFPYLWEFTHFHNGTGELVPDYLLDEMADRLESIWQSSEFSGVTSSRRALPNRQSNRLSNRRRPHSARHRANRRYATINKTALASSEFSGMGWTNGHTGLVGHFVAYDNWLWDMVRIGTISSPKELEREFMGGRARELESMSDIDWSQVDWNDVYNFLSGK